MAEVMRFRFNKDHLIVEKALKWYMRRYLPRPYKLPEWRPPDHVDAAHVRGEVRVRMDFREPGGVK